VQFLHGNARITASYMMRLHIPVASVFS